MHQSGLGHLLGVYSAVYDPGTSTTDYQLQVGFQYGPYGEILETGSAPLATPDDYLQRFNGKELDTATGLSYYGFRYYDPVTLAWNRADPFYRFLPEAAGTDSRSGNLYTFSLNNPVRYVDPDGLSPGPNSTGPWMPSSECGVWDQRTDCMHKKIYGPAGRWGQEDEEDELSEEEKRLLECEEFGDCPGMDNAPARRMLDSSKEVIRGAYKTATTIRDVAHFVACDGTVTDCAVALATTLAGGVLAKGVARLGARFAARLATQGGKAAGKLSRFVCFAAGTLVHTENNVLKPIERIETGDLVWARDEDSGALGLRRVVRTYVTPQKRLLKLEFENSRGVDDWLKVTPDHPFWVRDEGWVLASNIREGDFLRSISGDWLRVARTSALERNETVYNLEVDGFHTYFVGRLGAWVHNDCWDDIALHVLARGRFAGVPPTQVAAYLRAFAQTATSTTTQSGAKIWRRGAEILIQRPGAGPGGTWFQADSARQALNYMQRFIVDNGGIAF